MVKPKAILKEIEISADLNKIIKYHPASAVFLNDKTAKDYSTNVTVKILYVEHEGDQLILPDYQYANVVDATLPAQGHDANLLVMVKNILELEWSYYMTYYVLDEKSNKHINLHAHVIKQLEELKILVTILEQDKLSDVMGQLTLTELRPIENNKLKRYNVDGMQVEFADDDEKLTVIKLMINNRIKELSKPDYFYYNFNNGYLKEWSSVQVQEAIDRMALPFRDFKAKVLFCTLVCATVLNYLKGEMEWNQGNTEITENQGVFIHTLLCLFNFIDEEQESKNVTPRAKAKYIRGFFRKDLVNSDESFIHFRKVTNETKIKFNDNQWFKVVQK